MYNTEQQWRDLFALDDQKRVQIVRRVRAFIIARMISVPDGLESNDVEAAARDLTGAEKQAIRQRIIADVNEVIAKWQESIA